MWWLGGARPSRAGWALVVTGLACGSCRDGDEHVAPEEFSLMELRVPELGCAEEVPSLGDCRRHGDCAEGELCVRDRSYDPPDREPLALTCEEPRGAGGSRERCEHARDCATGLCALSGVCLDPCRASVDCGIGESCRPVEARTGGNALSPIMACARSVVLPPSVRLAIAPAPFRLRSGMNEIVVPKVAEPALMLLQGRCSGAGIELVSLRAVDARKVLYDQAALRKGERATNTVLHDGSALAALLFPNNPSIAPDALRIGVRVEAQDLAEVVVASRSHEGRTLDVNLFYVGGGEAWVDGGFRPGDPELPAVLARLGRRYRALGLALGEIREYDVVGLLREELRVLEVPRRMVDGREVEGRPLRLDELFGISSGVDDPGINVFVVSDMGGYVGIAGGIPGPLGVNGSQRSGVALAIDALGDLREAELVLMHEISHYMGLFHTTESTGTVLDPLNDTAECGIENDRDGDHQVSAGECASLGADNLMFWSGSGAFLSAQQREVLARSVLLR